MLLHAIGASAVHTENQPEGSYNVCTSKLPVTSSGTQIHTRHLQHTTSGCRGLSHGNQRHRTYVSTTKAAAGSVASYKECLWKACHELRVAKLLLVATWHEHIGGQRNCAMCCPVLHSRQPDWRTLHDYDGARAATGIVAHGGITAHKVLQSLNVEEL